jgi:hypothetical protein
LAALGRRPAASAALWTTRLAVAAALGRRPAALWTTRLAAAAVGSWRRPAAGARRGLEKTAARKMQRAATGGRWRAGSLSVPRRSVCFVCN